MLIEWYSAGLEPLYEIEVFLPKWCSAFIRLLDSLLRVSKCSKIPTDAKIRGSTLPWIEIQMCFERITFFIHSLLPPSK